MQHGTHFALLLRSHVSKLRWRPLVRVMFVTTNPLGPFRPSQSRLPVCAYRATMPCYLFHGPSAGSTRHAPVDTRRTSFILPPKTLCQHAWVPLRIRRQWALETGLPTLADTTTSTSPLPSKRTHPPWQLAEAKSASYLSSSTCRNTCVIKIIPPLRSLASRTTTPFFLLLTNSHTCPWGIAFFIARSEK
jgi:hypothetical protein